MIQGEGEDSFKRGVFTNEQLSQGYRKILVRGMSITMIGLSHGALDKEVRRKFAIRRKEYTAAARSLGSMDATHPS